MTKWFAIIYVYTLPFCLVEKLGSMTMFAIIAISLGFFGLDSISTELTDPVRGLRGRRRVPHYYSCDAD